MVRSLDSIAEVVEHAARLVQVRVRRGEVPKKLDPIEPPAARRPKLVRALLVAALAGAATDVPQKFPGRSPVIRWAIQAHSEHNK
jgi:hypothetical protein